MSGSPPNKLKFQVQPKTLNPSSPSHSSSSSFEFTLSSFTTHDEALTVSADELFYKGQLLPLHPSQRMSMVASLLLSSSSSASASSSNASRDSSGSTSSCDVVFFRDFNCDSSRPSSVAELDNDEFIELMADQLIVQRFAKKSVSLSFGKLASVFKKERKNETGTLVESCSLKQGKSASSARDVFRKYVKKVKPLYEKLSHKRKMDRSGVWEIRDSFSGSVERNGGVMASRSSCPASIMSSPCHSGAHSVTMVSKDWAMEELQSAIQGAIAHCKNSMLENKNSP